MKPSPNDSVSKPALMLPALCFGKGRGLLQRGEQICVQLFEKRDTAIELRPVDSSVVLWWPLPLLPVQRGFFLPAVGQFLTAYLRPRFYDGDPSWLSEEATLSLLSGDTLAAIMIACSFESSVAYNLSFLESNLTTLGSLLESRCCWAQREVSLREALLEKWSPLIVCWLELEPRERSKIPEWSQLLEAMQRHRRANRAERIRRCKIHVNNDPTMSIVRELPNWTEKLSLALDSCTDVQLEYLSECGFWSFARLSTDTAPFTSQPAP